MLIDEPDAARVPPAVEALKHPIDERAKDAIKRLEAQARVFYQASRDAVHYGAGYIRVNADGTVDLLDPTAVVLRSALEDRGMTDEEVEAVARAIAVAVQADPEDWRDYDDEARAAIAALDAARLTSDRDALAGYAAAREQAARTADGFDQRDTYACGAIASAIRAMTPEQERSREDNPVEPG